MKIKHLLFIITLLLYCYYMSDLYVFAYNNDIYDPDILDDTFTSFKVVLYLSNYIHITIIIVFIIPYRKINNILNKEIKIKKYEN